MKKNLQLLWAAVAIIIMAVNLESCSSYKGMASRPDGHNHWRPDFAGIHIKKHHANDKANARATAMANSTQTPVIQPAAHNTGVVAELKGEAPFKARIPKIVSKQINDDNIEKINNTLAKYSNNKVSVSKAANGKFYVKAASRNDFVKLTATLIKQSKSSAPISDETADILALVGGICGIVSIALCLIPWANYISFPTGIAGIVLGAISLHHTERRHKWALLGIILGAIGVFLAIVMTAVYFYFVYGVL